MNQCPYCGEWFWTYEELAAHIASVHAPLPTIFVCPYCGAEFSTEAELSAHINVEHPTPPPEPPPGPPVGYYLPFSVVAINTSRQGATPVAATLTVAVSLKMAGSQMINRVADQQFGPGETQTYPFYQYVDGAYFGQSIVIDALVKAPDGGILAVDSRTLVA